MAGKTGENVFFSSPLQPLSSRVCHASASRQNPEYTSHESQIVKVGRADTRQSAPMPCAVEVHCVGPGWHVFAWFASNQNETHLTLAAKEVFLAGPSFVIFISWYHFGLLVFWCGRSWYLHTPTSLQNVNMKGIVCRIVKRNFHEQRGKRCCKAGAGNRCSVQLRAMHTSTLVFATV